ncbi:DUF1302 domain-containing protein [Pseudomonas sp. C27(2019)]|uniref:DUF1302 domain-containing protein n=1 Tax=Pseudomonas sp. C27(2019) TaxID=2604941 RepID=UPI001243D92B|nr:DUF1302 domain-containing protein [Pseudomonas sp. C27(2019)]QEY59641.1 DUF1302 domain-containing protein [Pseudomonas sp. C27(2019)]
MTTKNQHIWRLAKLPMAVGLASLLAGPASAITFNIGEVEGSFDSSLSVGASWSTAKPDKRFIGNANGGTGFTQTGDDGRLNFQRGKTFSQIFKGLHDLELRYKDTGVFLRGKYWYDAELQDGSRPHKDISNKGRKEGAKTRGVELLDAFVYHNYAIADQPGTVRLGKQVVSWGESTFIMNSINSINPIDVSAFRRPGAELKEGLIPVNMFFVSQNLTDQLSMEAFYQLSWKQTVVDNCGTFFSGADVAADGCNDNYHILNKQLTQGIVLPSLGKLESLGLGVQASKEGLMIPRGRDNKAKDDGQWGTAFRWLGDNTEYGAYFMNYHSRTPFLSTQNADAATLAGALATGVPILPSPPYPPNTPNPNYIHPLAPAAVLVGRGNYFMDYPEDIRLYGLSFSTTLPTGTAWQGEISYRPNMPVQINTQDMTLKLTAGVSGLSTGATSMQDYQGRAGQNNRGYDRKEVTQIQTTFTHFFDQVLGASRATVVGEVGWTHVGGLGDTRYGRDAIFGSPESIIPDSPTSAQAHGWHGFVTKNSWGYRVRGILDYSDAFAGINLHPNMAFSHDVDGYGPNGQFNEGAKAVSFGVDADYQHTYTASLSYTNFFDGRYNTLKDRDFVSMSFGLNF